jgi:hypothetical protein
VVLKKAQLTMEDVMAETLEGKIDSFERFDRRNLRRGKQRQFVPGARLAMYPETILYGFLEPVSCIS